VIGNPKVKSKSQEPETSTESNVKRDSNPEKPKPKGSKSWRSILIKAPIGREYSKAQAIASVAEAETTKVGWESRPKQLNNFKPRDMHDQSVRSFDLQNISNKTANPSAQVQGVMIPPNLAHNVGRDTEGPNFDERASIIGEGRLLVPEQKRQNQAEKEHLKRKVSQ